MNKKREHILDKFLQKFNFIDLKYLYRRLIIIIGDDILKSFKRQFIGSGIKTKHFYKQSLCFNTKLSSYPSIK